MMRPILMLLAAAAFAVTALPCGLAAAAPSAAELTLVLSPPSGDPPSVSGTLSGSGWMCGRSGPAYGATVSPRGVATIDGAGNLSGNFTVNGGAGDPIDVTVTAYCDGGIAPIPMSKTATFHFNGPEPTPTRTKTPTPAPTSTPTAPPTSTPVPASTWTPTPAPASTWTPAPGAPSATATPAGATPGPSPPAGSQVLTIAGCVPSSPVSLEFVPLGLLGVDAAGGAATGPGFMVPAVQKSGEPHAFLFEPPPVEPGRLFSITPKVTDPDCAPDPQAPANYWISGQPVLVSLGLPGKTELEVCALGDKTPCEYAVVKGAFIRRGEPAVLPEGAAAAAVEGAWVVEKAYFAGDLKKGLQRFRSSTDVAAAGAAKLQASILPFPKGAEDDPLSPPGLLATWDIDCVNCEFTVDLSALAPATSAKKDAWYNGVFDVVAKPFQLVGTGAKKLVKKTGNLVGIGGGKKSTPEVVTAGEAQLPPLMPGDSLVAGQNNVLLQPPTFYFRLLPLDGEAVAGALSNAVRFQQVDKPPKLNLTNPTPSPTPVLAYEVKFITYHGIIPPLVQNDTCYIATADAWPADIYGLKYTTDSSKAVISGPPTVKKGQPICPPKPKEPSILESILSWAEYVVDWTSQAWSDLKSFAVDIVLKYTPLGALCTSVAKSSTCTAAFNMALDATLVALGIPPDIPNFDELMDQGIEYVAAQAAAQVGIPKEVVQAAVDEGGPLAGWALDAAEEELRKELQAQIEAKLGDAAKSIQLGYAASVSWVPDGIPVRPDDYLPPGMTARVTRKAGVPGGDAGCTLRIYDKLTLAKATLDTPPAGYDAYVKSLKHPLSHLTPYDLFADEAGTAGDKQLFVPPLAAGESFEIPLTFIPNYYKSGWSPSGLTQVTDYISIWRFLHDFGTIHLNAFGTCGETTLTAPAAAILIGAEIVP